MAVKFKADTDRVAGVYSDGGSPAQYVLVDGVIVGVVRKRAEWYGNLGHRGVTYRYYDFFRVDGDNKALYEKTEIEMRDGSTRTERRPLASNSTRKQSVAEALLVLGYEDAAREVDPDAPRWRNW